jgi:hypothetical protein
MPCETIKETSKVLCYQTTFASDKTWLRHENPSPTVGGGGGGKEPAMNMLS